MERRMRDQNNNCNNGPMGSDKKLNKTVVDLSEKVSDVETQMTKLYR